MVDNIDVVHGGYYALMHLWVGLFGASPASLRLPSALAVGVGTVGVYLLGRRLLGPGAASWAAVSFAVLPRVTWMGIEARSFGFTAAMSVWLTLLLVLLVAGAIRSGGRVAACWVAYGALAAVAIVVNIYTVLLLGAHFISLVLLWRRTNWPTRWAWLGASVAGFVVASPVVLEATRQSGQLGGERYGWLRLIRSIAVNQYLLGETPTVETGSAGAILDPFESGGLWKLASVMLALIAWFLVLWAIFAARWSKPVPPNEQGDLLVWTLPWIVLPTIAIGVYSVYFDPLYNGRYFSFTTPAFALLLGFGLAMLRPAWLRLSVTIMALLLVLPIYVSQRVVNAKSGSDWSQVAALLAERQAPGDAVYFAPRYPITGPTYGQSTRGIAVAYPEDFSELQDLTLLVSGAQDATLTGQSRLLQDAVPELADVNRIWVVRRNGDPSETESKDRGLLRAAGFTPGATWRGTLDTVTLFERS